MHILQRPPSVRLPAPTTLKHFKLLARLGRAPSIWLYDDIETGMEFYFSEEDYLSASELSGASHSKSASAGNRSRRARHAVKSEASPTPGPSTAGPSRLAEGSSGSAASGSSSGAGSGSSKKRPRRSVATSVKSYVIPDSDDEDIAGEGEDESVRRFAKKRKAETNMQRWIKQLDVLLKEEQRKVRSFTALASRQLPVALAIAARLLCRQAVWLWLCLGVIDEWGKLRKGSSGALAQPSFLAAWWERAQAADLVRRSFGGAREREKRTRLLQGRTNADADRRGSRACVCSFEFGVWKSGGARQGCVWCVRCLVFVRPAENMGILAGVHSF